MAVKSCIAVMPAFAARRTAMWMPPFSIVWAPRSFCIRRGRSRNCACQMQTGTGSPEPAPAFVGAEVLSEHQSDRDWNEHRVRVVVDVIFLVEDHVPPGLDYRSEAAERKFDSTSKVDTTLVLGVETAAIAAPNAIQPAAANDVGTYSGRLSHRKRPDAIHERGQKGELRFIVELALELVVDHLAANPERKERSPPLQKTSRVPAGVRRIAEIGNRKRGTGDNPECNRIPLCLQRTQRQRRRQRRRPHK